MARGTRTQECTPAQARVRLQQAQALLDVAELVQQDPSDVALPSVTASLAVLAGIAASDAACCAALRRRPRGQNHQESVAILATVNPGGNQMSQDLRRLVAAKDDSHYGLALVSASKAQQLLRAARRLASASQQVVDRY